MKTIALVELQEHQEVLFSLIDLLLEHHRALCGPQQQ